MLFSVTALFAMLATTGHGAPGSRPTVGGQAVGGTGLPTWLAGCWSNTGTPSVSEHWVLAGDALIGVGTTVASGRLREFEWLRIVVEGPAESPTVTYLAQPGGAPPTRFARESGGPSEIVFANPAHDFPKRVGYRRTGDALLAWIDGGTDSSKRVEFPMRKVPCER